MTDLRRLEKVRELVAGYAEVTADDAPLELDSLSMVQLAEDLEAEFDFVLRADDLEPTSFGSVAAITAFLGRVAP